MDKVWPCEHIVKRGDDWAYIHAPIHIFIDEIKYCELCGAKRPEKQKTLTEKLSAMRGFTDSDKLAQTCYEHVNEIAEKAVEEIDIPIGPNHDMELGAIVIFKIELLRRLKASL